MSNDKINQSSSREEEAQVPADTINLDDNDGISQIRDIARNRAAELTARRVVAEWRAYEAIMQLRSISAEQRVKTDNQIQEPKEADIGRETAPADSKQEDDFKRRNTPEVSQSSAASERKATVETIEITPSRQEVLKPVTSTTTTITIDTVTSCHGLIEAPRVSVRPVDKDDFQQPTTVSVQSERRSLDLSAVRTCDIQNRLQTQAAQPERQRL